MRKTINISLSPDVYDAAKKGAEELGITVSAFISMLIARNKTERKKK